MTQQERLDYLLAYLLHEHKEFSEYQLSDNFAEKQKLLRSLMNIRPVKSISQEFLAIQDSYLQEELTKSPIISLHDLSYYKPQIYLWKGDITKIKVDAIVNAANSALLGCFIPCHGCIDNAIHSSAGIQLRLACQRIMQTQGKPEASGKAKITKGYNLPANYVLHTVGPIIHGQPTAKDCNTLAACYRSCLELAESYHLKSLTFCCISTGEFHFPEELAATIAINSVTKYLTQTGSEIEVVFDVFKETDYNIYRRLLD